MVQWSRTCGSPNFAGFCLLIISWNRFFRFDIVFLKWFEKDLQSDARQNQRHTWIHLIRTSISTCDTGNRPRTSPYWRRECCGHGRSLAASCTIYSRWKRRGQSFPTTGSGRWKLARISSTKGSSQLDKLTTGGETCRNSSNEGWVFDRKWAPEEPGLK